MKMYSPVYNIEYQYIYIYIYIYEDMTIFLYNANYAIVKRHVINVY